MSKKSFILDTDIGSDIDDAMALLLCLKSDEFPLKAITTVYNCAELRAKIAKKMTLLADKNIPVGIGIDLPLDRGGLMWETGLEGIGMLSKSEMRIPPSYFGINENGIELLISTIREYSNVEIISIGQFSNIATALIREPQLAEDISRIWSMSAGVSFIDPIPEDFPNPNKTYKAIPSHNIRIDKKAAQIVLNSKIPITFIGNDVTTQTFFYENQVSKIQSQDSPLNQKVMDMARIWLTYRSRRLEQDEMKTCLHDALVVAETMGMNFTERVPIDIKLDEFGGTEIQYNPESIYEIAYKVDSKSFMKWFIKRVSN